MSSECRVSNPLDRIEQNLKVVAHIELGPGPSNYAKNVVEAMSIQPVAFFNKNLFQIFDEIQEMARYVFQTNNALTVVQQTSGNGGNEAMVTNLADPGDTVIVGVQGVWGSKVADMGRRYNLNVVELSISKGENYSFDYLEEQIIKHNAVALFLTHGESTGGTLQPLDGLGKICHKHNCLLGIDAVVSLGVVPVLTDEWELDAVNAGTQKGLGAPTGMTLLTFSDRAHKRMLSKKHRPPYIYDMLTLGNYWKCFGQARQYLYSYGTHMLNGVRQALLNICQEGLENVWQRHREASELFLNNIGKLGITNFVEKAENRFLGVNIVVLPDGVNRYLIMDYVIDKYNMEFSFGVGPSVGNILRVGFLGDNARTDIVQTFLQALEEGMEYASKNPDATKDSPTIQSLMQWRL